MITAPKPRALLLASCLQLLLSSLTVNVLSSPLPADLAMNPGAGRGGLLFVTLRLDNGKKLPFVLDTGCPTTCLDQSLEPLLGKRLKSDVLWAFGDKSQINYYFAPKLFWGRTLLLKDGPMIVTHDCRQMSAAVGRPIMGVLGMDILQNYCIQLDFTARKIRFLDAQRANKRSWGKPFPLVNISDGCPAINDNLTGANGIGSLVDTGCSYDGWLVPQFYQQWTDHSSPPPAGQADSPNGVLDGQTYSALDLHGVDMKLLSTGDSHIQFNGLGLRFLSRHLVTLDFPEHTLYLKRTSADPLVNPNVNTPKSDVENAAQILKDLKQKGQLPGWSNTDALATGNITFRLDSNSITFDMSKAADTSVYHYTLSRPATESPWRLQKAWRSDAHGQTLEEYTLP